MRSHSSITRNNETYDYNLQSLNYLETEQPIINMQKKYLFREKIFINQLLNAIVKFVVSFPLCILVNKNSIHIPLY
jgi:hypothetical protein